MLKTYFFDRSKRFQQVSAVLVVVIVAAVGTYLLVGSHAATPYVSITADTGTLASGATKQACSGSSDGNCVVFGGSKQGLAAPISEMALNSGQQNYLGNTSNYGYIILQSSMHASVAAIKAANPNTKVLMYKNASFMESGCQYAPYMGSGLNTCDANNGHQDWYLTRNGQPFVAPDYTYLYWADIGDASYQQAWLSSVSSVAKANGFDGVFLDDVNTSPGHGQSANGLENTNKAYSDLQYGQAMLSFMQAVGPGLKSQGLLAVPNLSANPWDSTQESLAEQIAPYTTSVFREFFMHWNQTTPGLFSGAIWESLMEQMTNISNVTGYIANTYDTSFSTQDMLYGRASFLLGWNGKTNSAYQFDLDSSTINSYNSLWALDVGTPTNTRYQIDGGWKRDFTGGTIVVNPSSTATITIPLGSPYTAPDGSSVSSVTLPPTSASILKN